MPSHASIAHPREETTARRSVKSARSRHKRRSPSKLRSRVPLKARWRKGAHSPTRGPTFIGANFGRRIRFLPEHLSRFVHGPHKSLKYIINIIIIAEKYGYSVVNVAARCSSLEASLGSWNATSVASKTVRIPIDSRSQSNFCSRSWMFSLPGV
jgi:hypothetical protein